MRDEVNGCWCVERRGGRGVQDRDEEGRGWLGLGVMGMQRGCGGAEEKRCGGTGQLG